MSPATDQAIEKYFLCNPARILVATDLTDQEQLMPHIIAQAKASGALVTLVHAIKPDDCRMLEGCAGCGMVEAAKAEAQSALDAMTTSLETQGISCTHILKLGFAADVVMDQIRITGATRLIMTSHGRGKVGQFLFGSVANQLLGRAGIPVFVVSPKCKVPPPIFHSGQILHPVSLHEDVKETAAFAIEFARKYQASLTLLHVYDSREQMLLGEAAVPTWSEKLLAELGLGDGKSDPTISIAVGYGDVLEEIRRETLRRVPDLIVMGVKEDTWMWPLPESVAYRIMATSTCPVLAVRHHSVPVKSIHAENLLPVLQ